MAREKVDELELVDNVLKGQTQYYREIIDRYSPMVFHVVRGFIKDEDEVEELAQQIFVKTYEKLDSFDGKSKFSSWLYMIAKNHCRDYVKNIRRKNRRFSEMDSRELQLQADMINEETPDQNIIKDEWGQMLEKALGKINPENAEVFLMKYRDEMSYKAISKRLNVTVSALKVRVHRARKELKQVMEYKGD